MQDLHALFFSSNKLKCGSFLPSTFDTEAPFLDLNLSITNGIVSSYIYNNQDDFNLEIVYFPFLDGDVFRSPSYDVYFSQLICFARVCYNVDDFEQQKLILTT